jgi:hypothetical protein
MGLNFSLYCYSILEVFGGFTTTPVTPLPTVDIATGQMLLV